MKWYIPKEHGAWAMLVVPYWMGAVISGLSFHHFIFFAGILSIYFAQAPLLTFIRQPKYRDVWPSFFVYIMIGTVFIFPYIWVDPILLGIGMAIFPLFCINILFAKIKKERWFINDLVAITALSSLLLLAFQIGQGKISSEAFDFILLNIVFFTASVFHVKSLLREKGNRLFINISRSYHLAMTVIAFGLLSIGAGLAFMISLIKTRFLPRKYMQLPSQIGIIEIINSALFFGLVIVWHFY